MKEYEKPDFSLVNLENEERIAVCGEEELPPGAIKSDDGKVAYIYHTPQHGVSGCTGTVYLLNVVCS